MRIARTLVGATALVLTLSGCSSLQGTGDKGFVTGDGTIRRVAAADRGSPVSLDGTDLKGKRLSLDSTRGKPVVVQVWGSWCTPCRAEAPMLVTAHRKLGKTADFVGVDIRDSGSAQPSEFVRHFGVDWPSYFSPDGQALLAFKGTLTPNTIPAIVVLDAQGRMAASVVGSLPSSLTLVELVSDVT
ncbi:MAG: TlpA family protein disulfide reductase [Nocardioides sp.]